MIPRYEVRQYSESHGGHRFAFIVRRDDVVIGCGVDSNGRDAAAIAIEQARSWRQTWARIEQDSDGSTVLDAQT